MYKKLIFIFLDGIGVGRSSGNNPFFVASMPFVEHLVGGRIVDEVSVREPDILLKGIDANLGVNGIPQSATGQTTLFTGRNAAKFLGRHLTAFPNKPLVELINEYSILKSAKNKGLKVTFANAYSPNYFQLVKLGLRFHSATTRCVFAAEIPFRFIDHLLDGNAVCWDLTNSFLQHQIGIPIPIVSPYISGMRLANLSKTHDLVLYECFLPDIIGHKKETPKAIEFLEALDSFINGVVSNKEADVTVLITSDHGNLEDLSTGSHTNNLVPFLVSGPMAKELEYVESIADILGAVL